MYAELRTTGGVTLATITTRTPDVGTAMRGLARKAGLTYREPALVTHYPGGGTFHVQFGRFLPRLQATTLSRTYIVWCEGVR